MGEFQLRVRSLLGDTDVPLDKMQKSGSSKGTPSCSKCSLFGKKQVIEPTNRNADILLVGEAPGKNEEDQGRIFVGRSGKLLRECLDLAGFNTERIQFANCCLCRPSDEEGNNRTPTNAEISICSALHLSKILGKYKHIIAVGKIPEFAILGEVKQHIRGNIVVKDDTRVATTYHPAFVYRNQYDTELKKSFIEDLRFFNKVFSGKHSVKFTVVENEEIRKKCLKDTEASELSIFDLETTGLTLDSIITTIGIDGNDTTYSIPIVGKYVENVPLIKKLFSFSHKKYIGYNTAFDYGMLLTKGLCDRKIKLEDIMIMTHLLDSTKDRGEYQLKNVAVKKGIRWSYLLLDPSNVKNFDDLLVYNAEDVINERMLYEKSKEEMRKRKLIKVAEEIVFPAMPTISEMEVGGIRIDLDEMRKIKTKLSSQIEILKSELTDRFGAINWGSPTQLQPLLLKLAGRAVKTTPTGKLCTDEESLRLYIDAFNANTEVENRKDVLFLCESLLKLREASKMLSTYIDGLSKKVDASGRLHGHFSLIGTSTGRLSSSGPNLQNIPRDGRIKAMFIPSDGRILVESDLSQIELRVVASYAPEIVMIDAYNKSIDLHALTASITLGTSIDRVTKKQRQMAKAVNFGLIYGQSAQGFKMYAKSKFNIQLSDEQANKFREAFFTKYTGIRRWHELTERKVIGGETSVTSPFGRIRKLDGEDIGQKIRQALNTPIQSAASDCNLMAMRFIWDRVDPSYCNFLLTVHDSFLLDVEKSKVDKVVNLIHESAEYVSKMCKWLKVPILFDVKTGKNWGEMNEIK